MDFQTPKPELDRRNFIKKVIAATLAGIAALVPIIAAVRVLTDPLRRKSASTSAIRITTLEALPINGIPAKFAVFSSKTDAWNKFSNVPIGAIYLRRTGEKTVEALNVVCPHAGCFVDFSAKQNEFICPCHKSSFKMDGAIANPGSPSPRGLDSLQVDIRGDEVWVQFQNFQAGRADKVATA